MAQKAAYQLLVLIATPKLADKAAAMFLESALPIQYRLGGEGTASSEIMDTLGLGSIDKAVLVSTVPRSFGRRMLELLHTRLRLDAVNSGIAFTLPLTGGNRLLLRLMQQTAAESGDPHNGKDDSSMAERNYALVTAIVNRGYSSEVMEAARAAGAGGGTVVHSRSIDSEAASAFWGLGVQEEKELVLILAPQEDKTAIMSAISARCGTLQDAKGLVMSLPIDDVMGI